MHEIKLSKEQTNQFNLINFREYLSIAPGVVLIKAPGHTASEIMIYVKLKNQKQYIITGDVYWTHQGIETQTPKPLAQIKCIKENLEQIAHELEWLHNAAQKNVHIIVNHDKKLHQSLAKKN